MSDREHGLLSRRRFMRNGALAVGALGASSGVAAAQSGGDYGGWFTGDGKGGAAKNYDGTTVDKTGQDTVTVDVGASGNGGTYAFAPPAMRVSPGTKVVFKWVSNTHNVVVEDQPSGANWQGESAIKDEGYTYSYTFQTAGTYTYYCEPHLALGMKGAIVVGGGAGAGSGSPAWGDWFTDKGKGGAVKNYDGTTVDKTGQDSVTVEVGANGNDGTYAFAPPAVKIDPGTEVEFKWVSDTHNVVVEKQPDGAGWQGESAIKDEGFTYSHTFNTSGTYEYYCEPHLALGMKGGIFVTGSSSGGAGGSGFLGSFDPSLATSTWLFGPAVVALLASLWYFADDYQYRRAQREPTEPTRPPETDEAPVSAPANPIDHDDYDPWGTATLIAAYLLILVVAWTLMYFIEFLGHGPHILT